MKFTGDSLAVPVNRDTESGVTALCVSVDGGWQTRGSGRSYNSLSGHASMVGCNTKKIIAYDSRKTTCRTCTHAKRNGTDIKDHDCRLNYAGSAKSMEADMTVSMVKKIDSDRAKVQTIVGDEDSTTMYRVHKECDVNIQKRSDSNHLKKIITNNLKKLQAQHKISDRTIKYVIKNFNYMCHANQGNEAGIVKGLKALSAHPFGDHSHCDSSWCRFIDNPQEKYTTLPYGKPLTDGNLRAKLKEIFTKYEDQPEKLANMKSTQVNENFNGMVATKAPKAHHYSGSEGLDFRLGAAVAQKNIGHVYLSQVYEKKDLSPGTFTKGVATRLDQQNKKRKAVAATKKAKMKRLQLKTEKSQRASCKETREGTTYASGIALQVQVAEDVQEIPPATIKPVQEPLLKENIKEGNHIYFDLETTGFERTSHITQIAAVRNDDRFSCYVMPKKTIQSNASTITGIKNQNGVLYHNSIRVESYNISEALDKFIEFINETNVNILIGHNIQSYDCPVLMNALDSCGKLHSFFEKVIGFIDTKKLIKQLCPEQKSYKQVDLVRNLMDESYDAHNALEDVSSLQRLVKHLVPQFTSTEIEASTFLPKYCLESHKYSAQANTNLPSLQPLIDLKVVKKTMARSIAGSGLCFNHLVLAYERNGQDGIRDIFSEMCTNNHVRVTKSSKIIDAVSDYISKQQAES